MQNIEGPCGNIWLYSSVYVQILSRLSQLFYITQCLLCMLTCASSVQELVVCPQAMACAVLGACATYVGAASEQRGGGCRAAHPETGLLVYCTLGSYSSMGEALVATQTPQCPGSVDRRGLHLSYLVHSVSSSEILPGACLDSVALPHSVTGETESSECWRMSGSCWVRRNDQVVLGKTAVDICTCADVAV